MNSIADVLQSRATEKPLSTAFTFLGEGEGGTASVTFSALDLAARTVAGHLQARTAPGDRVLLVLPPGLDYIIGFFACLYAGVIAVPALPPSNPRHLPRLRNIAADVAPRLILSDEKIIDRYAHSAALPLGQDVAWFPLAPLLMAGPAWRHPGHDDNGNALAFIQYSSGSTGAPKGVEISHANLLANSSLSQRTYGLQSGDVMVSWLPPHHDFGLVGGILLPVFVGAHCVHFAPAAFLMRPYRWLKAISDYRAKMTGAPNFAYELCARKVTPEQKSGLDLSVLEVAVSGAERVRPETLSAFAQAFAACGFRPEAFTPAYGLAESTLLVCAATARVSNALPKVMRVDRDALGRGVALPCVDQAQSLEFVAVGADEKQAPRFAIVDPDTRQALPCGRVGEIWIRGASVAHGYWRKPEESQAVFGASIDGIGGHFLRSGDLGFMAEDHLFIVGRSKEVLVFDGRNLFPQDIEASVEALDAAFRPDACAAFSVERDDGEHLVIFQELDSRAAPVAAGLEERVREALADEHGVMRLEAMCLLKAGQLPRTSSGKIQRSECRKLYSAGSLAYLWSWHAEQRLLAEPGRAPAGVTEVTVAAIAADVLQLPNVAANVDLFLLGAHSLSASQMLIRLHAAFSPRADGLTLHQLFEARTVEEISLKIDALQDQIESFEV
ncbi:AMP-binding protein [Massilia rubra]|uniref:AMP-binding protein n=1 Tax=Massilia rubra TaxID=2607910 RepID=A0ABX0LMG6_9BURK|nr:AMP-binding protein [Massilia rubra]NHZ35813.1 AMP-binding protein [Massilia rubra]